MPAAEIMRIIRARFCGSELPPHSIARRPGAKAAVQGKMLMQANASAICSPRENRLREVIGSWKNHGDFTARAAAAFLRLMFLINPGRKIILHR